MVFVRTFGHVSIICHLILLRHFRCCGRIQKTLPFLSLPFRTFPRSKTLSMEANENSLEQPDAHISDTLPLLRFPNEVFLNITTYIVPERRRRFRNDESLQNLTRTCRRLHDFLRSPGTVCHLLAQPFYESVNPLHDSSWVKPSERYSDRNVVVRLGHFPRWSARKDMLSSIMAYAENARHHTPWATLHLVSSLRSRYTDAWTYRALGQVLDVWVYPRLHLFPLNSHGDFAFTLPYDLHEQAMKPAGIRRTGVPLGYCILRSSSLSKQEEVYAKLWAAAWDEGGITPWRALMLVRQSASDYLDIEPELVEELIRAAGITDSVWGPAVEATYWDIIRGGTKDEKLAFHLILTKWRYRFRELDLLNFREYAHELNARWEFFLDLLRERVTESDVDDADDPVYLREGETEATAWRRHFLEFTRDKTNVASFIDNRMPFMSKLVLVDDRGLVASVVEGWDRRNWIAQLAQSFDNYRVTIKFLPKDFLNDPFFVAQYLDEVRKRPGPRFRDIETWRKCVRNVLSNHIERVGGGGITDVLKGAVERLTARDQIFTHILESIVEPERALPKLSKKRRMSSLVAS